MMRRERISQRTVDMIASHLGTGAIIARIGDVDITRGAGVVGKATKCLWTKDKCRITISLASDGGTIASCANDPDPEWPEEPCN